MDALHDKQAPGEETIKICAGLRALPALSAIDGERNQRRRREMAAERLALIAAALTGRGR